MNENWMPPAGYEKIAKEPPQYNKYSENFSDLTEEQENLLDRISKINDDVHILKLMYASVDPFHYTMLGSNNPGLVNAHRIPDEIKNLRLKRRDVAAYHGNGEELAQLDGQISSLEAELEESNNFYLKDQKAYMFSNSYEPKLHGRSLEDLDEETLNFLTALEGMGFSKESVKEELAKEVDNFTELTKKLERIDGISDSPEGFVNEKSAIVKVLINFERKLENEKYEIMQKLEADGLKNLQ